MHQTLDKSRYEIIVIDNNSNDTTKEVFASFTKRYPHHNWVYFFEPKQGLHYARNRGILLARSEIIVFGDDDIEASPGWLEAILHAFEKDNKIGIVGGPIFPIWDCKPPDWIYDYGTDDYHGVFALLNYGNTSRILEKEEVFGSNLAIKRKLAIEVNGSGPDTFPGHMIHFSGSGETAMLVRVRNKGSKVYYEANAYVKHHASVERCNRDYFIYRYKRWAVEGIYNQYNSGKSLYRIFLGLIIKSLRLLISMVKPITVNNKRNRKTFLMIMLHYMIFGWIHYYKLLSDPILREHSSRKEHLGELTQHGYG